MKYLFSFAATLFLALVDLFRDQCPHETPGCDGRTCEDCGTDSMTGGWG